METSAKSYAEEFDKLFALWMNGAGSVVPKRTNTDADFEYWLRQQTPEIWHCIFQYWNYDSQVDLLWFAEHEDFDAGTAARMLQLGYLDYCKDLNDPKLSYYREGAFYQFYAKLYARWLAVDFKSGKFKIESQPEYIHERISLSLKNLSSEGKTPEFPYSKSLWSYEGQRVAKAEYYFVDNDALVPFNLWIKSYCEDEGVLAYCLENSHFR